jgi:two-component system response regulator FixJ
LLEEVCAKAGYEPQAYASALEFLESSEDLTGCLLTDLRMPGVDGIALLRRLRKDGILIPAIVMTAHGDIRTAATALKIGATDFIEKPFHNDDLIELIGKALASTSPADVLAARRTSQRIKTLTPRERQVCDLLMEGLPTKVIAGHLQISPRTAEIHRSRALSKMGASTLVELVRLHPIVDLLQAAEQRASLPS